MRIIDPSCWKYILEGVDAANSTTVPVCIFNPHCYPVIVRQDSVVGQVKPVDIVSTVLKCKNPGERGNYSVMRRVLLNEKSTLPNKASRVMKGQEKLFAQYIQKPLVPPPEHLKEFYEWSAKGKTVQQQKVIHWLLLKHQSVFSKNENELGHTHLVEHAIDMGDAKPIKQLPNQLPMAYENEDHKVLANLQAQGVIEPSTSPCTSPILLVKK